MQARTATCGFLALAGAIFALAAGVRFAAVAQTPAAADTQRHLTVTAQPVVFDPADPQRTSFGALTFLGGIAVSSPNSNFGGISGIVVSHDGKRFAAVTDIGYWLQGGIDYTGKAISGLSGVTLSPIRGPAGEKLTRKKDADAEGLAAAAGRGIGGNLLVSFERNHRIARYAFGARGPAARPVHVNLPAEIGLLEANQGLEAIGVFPAQSPLPGALIAFAERHLNSDGDHTGWLAGGPAPGKLALKRSDYFDVTDLQVLDSGDLVILERRYSLLSGPAMRIRRIAAHTVRPGALLDGPVLIEAGLPYAIDNMEGLGLHRRADGALVLTIVSDDNFRSVQRTLFLQFELRE